MIFNIFANKLFSFCVAAAFLISTLRIILDMMIIIARLLIRDFNITNDVAEASAQQRFKSYTRNRICYLRELSRRCVNCSHLCLQSFYISA